PSDDPTTELPDDPTQIVVGNLPLLYAQKTVAIHQDYGTPGILDPGDVLRYTIAINNFGAIAATGVQLKDVVPPDTTYNRDSARLNGAPLPPDNGTLPLIPGLAVQSPDHPGVGIISPGETAVVTFEARVNDGVETGTEISNQGTVHATGLPDKLTDSDGVIDNGDQPTRIWVGAGQWLTITNQVAVVGGGPALAGGQLEYTLRVTNVGSLPALRVRIIDDLNPTQDDPSPDDPSPGDLTTYVDGSCTLDGAPVAATHADGVLMVDYGSLAGDLPSTDSAVVRFRVLIKTGLDIGATITNSGRVTWNDPPQTTLPAIVAIDVGGMPGAAALNGHVWHDANLDRELPADGETCLADWTVTLLRNGQPVISVTTDTTGAYSLGGLIPNAGTHQMYELRFIAPGAGPHTAAMGWGDSRDSGDSRFTDLPQGIGGIAVTSGSNLQGMNLPLWPNGAVYNSVARVGVAGARLQLLDAASGEALSASCFDDPVQQGQVTAADGFYKFDLNFSQDDCPPGGAYRIKVVSPKTGFLEAPSNIIPPASHAGTAPFIVSACPGSSEDAVPDTAEYCEATTQTTVPPQAVLPGADDTRYYLHLVLNNGMVPGHNQVFNNAIPIDPVLDGAVAITKVAAALHVTRGDLVPYTITVTNIFGAPLHGMSIVDRFPAGFKYVAGSARLDDTPVEPQVNGLTLTWPGLTLLYNQTYTLQLLLVVGAGVSEGDYVNRAKVFSPALAAAVSGEATATVRVIPDPDFDCTDIIGKVFDDRNRDGRQDEGEKGLQGVRVVTVQGLIATTDAHGRYHITCAAVPDQDRGSNFILKLDERSLPSGYRLTTENPRVQRVTRGKMARFNFGATIHRVVRMDIADGVFEPKTTNLRLQWTPKIDQLVEELKLAPSVLRLSYLADTEREGLVNRRLDALKQEIVRLWDGAGGGYPLSIETEVFWRRGRPFNGR
ncbi:MAG: DUF11 domain-containing protein, partial [Desulfatitalea sp.]|nr:DUF11 domain-containing protein [Desulfatitalea sp.]